MQKTYWLSGCPHCGGSGRIPAKSDTYRLVEELQDEGPYFLPDKPTTLREAMSLAKAIKKGPFGSSTMIRIVAPDGEVTLVKDQSPNPSSGR
jgi:hypothetical protein